VLPCVVPNGSGSKNCPSTGLFTECIAETCNEGFVLEAGACSSVQITDDPDNVEEPHGIFSVR
jgi:hypothetical protein